jgi:hypothetical protein
MAKIFPGDSMRALRNIEIEKHKGTAVMMAAGVFSTSEKCGSQIFLLGSAMATTSYRSVPAISN